MLCLYYTCSIVVMTCTIVCCVVTYVYIQVARDDCQGSKGPCAQHMWEGLSRGGALVAKSKSQVTRDKVMRLWGK
jgi:hypothetical protein